jgi:hypothetical protein
MLKTFCVKRITTGSRLRLRLWVLRRNPCPAPVRSLDSIHERQAVAIKLITAIQSFCDRMPIERTMAAGDWMVGVQPLSLDLRSCRTRSRSGGTALRR